MPQSAASPPKLRCRTVPRHLRSRRAASCRVPAGGKQPEELVCFRSLWNPDATEVYTARRLFFPVRRVRAVPSCPPWLLFVGRRAGFWLATPAPSLLPRPIRYSGKPGGPRCRSSLRACLSSKRARCAVRACHHLTRSACPPKVRRPTRCALLSTRNEQPSRGLILSFVLLAALRIVSGN